MVAKKAKKTASKTSKKVQKKEVKKDVKKTVGVSKKTESKKESTICKTEAIYLAAGVVIGILIMFAYTQINANPEVAANNGVAIADDTYISLAEAEAIVLNVVEMDPNLEMLNVTPSIVNSTKNHRMYSVNVKLAGPQGDTVFNSFITMDGKVLFPKGIDIEEYKQTIEKMKNEKKEAEQKNTDNSNAGASSNKIIKQSANPQLEAYVVSRCPYGLQMQRIMAEIIKEIPEASNNIMIRYMGAVVDNKITSMHGDAEAQENLRQICLREEQADKYWPYASCYIKEGKTDECLTSSAVDINKLNACMTDPSKGLAYAQVDFDLNKKYSVRGSPTLIMNDERVSEFDFGGRTAEAVKSVLCGGFTTKPEYCSTVLTKENAAASFSPTYSGKSGIGSC